MNIYGRIYCVTNLVNGMRYVGKTTQTLAGRWKHHCRKSECRQLFQRAIAKHGAQHFRIEEVAVAHSRAELDALERAYIAELNTLVPGGYNLGRGGEGGPWHESSRAKLSASKRAFWADPTNRARMLAVLTPTDRMHEARRAKKGPPKPKAPTRTRTEQRRAVWARPGYREKHAAAMKAARESPQYRANMAAALKERCSDPDFIRTRTEAIRVGKQRAAEHRAAAALR